MRMTFPTQGIVEKCLTKIFQGLPNNSLTMPVSIIGNVPEYHQGSVSYGTLPVSVNTIIGIDIPILLTNDDMEGKETVAIVAQDPLRNIKDDMLQLFYPFQKPIVGTPFAFHYASQLYKQTEVYRSIISGLLAKGYKVYITDIWKCWDKYKTTRRGRWGRGNPHFDCLAEELCTIKPKVVILMGKEAQRRLTSKLFGNIFPQGYKPTYVPVPHPSASANGKWCKKIGKCDIGSKVSYILDETFEKL